MHPGICEVTVARAPCPCTRDCAADAMGEATTPRGSRHAPGWSFSKARDASPREMLGASDKSSTLCPAPTHSQHVWFWGVATYRSASQVVAERVPMFAQTHRRQLDTNHARAPGPTGRVDPRR